MAGVRLAVGGLFQRAEHKGGICVPPVPAPRGLLPGQPAGRRRHLPGRARREPLAERRRRHAERRQLLQQAFDPRRIGLGVDAVDGGDAAVDEELRHPLVGEDHQPLDQPVGLGLRHPVGGDDVALGVELELRLGRFDVERGGAAVLAERGGHVARRGQRFGDRRGRLLAAVEDAVELVVVEPRVGADAAAVEAGAGRPRLAVELDLGGDREPLHPRREAAGAAGERRAAASARPSPARRSSWRGAAPPCRAASRAARGRRRRRCGPRRASPRPRAGRRRRRRSRARWPGRR